MMTFVFMILFLLILCFPALSFQYASNGLLLWFNEMIPVLLPFMILSSIMIRQNLTEQVVALVYPILRKLFGCTKNGAYCMVLGFLCGFPMGAKTVNDLYLLKKLSKRESEFLLSFCNNIGPVYIITFLLPSIGLSGIWNLLWCLPGIYGIPLLYGYLLHKTGFLLPKKSHLQDYPTKACSKQDCLKQACTKEPAVTETFSKSLDYAMHSSIDSITVLGAYMVICNLLNIIPHVLFHLFPVKNHSFQFLSCLLEITGGIKTIGSQFPFFVLSIVPFGGLSCMLQTKSMIRNTDLSMKHYLIHKVLQTLGTAIYFFLCSFFLV